MPTYITLINFTEQGIRTVKEAPSRLAAAREAVRAAGGEVRAVYLVLGRYDLVAISDFPSDEAYARAVLTIAAQGDIRTETLRAFSEEEFRQIAATLP